MDSKESSGEEPRIRIRGRDGEGADRDPSHREPSGDPEIDELWAFSMDELKIILEDENHPLHVKAKQLSAEIVAPIRELYRTPSFLSRINSSWPVPKFNIYPKINLSGAALAAWKPPFKPFKVNFGAAFTAALERYRESRPPNWPSGVKIDCVIRVIQDDGIPLVWVPRAEVVSEMLAAPNRSARVGVLLDHINELIEDCREVLNGISHASLTGQLPLALKALEALEAGHAEAAQALAVVVTETAVARGISGKYQEVKKQVLFDPELVPYTQLRLRAALAPIGPFYTQWYADSGTPAPEGLSRHVAVHQADLDHYTPGNAVVAVLLATSVLRALQELQELAEATDQ